MESNRNKTDGNEDQLGELLARGIIKEVEHFLRSNNRAKLGGTPSMSYSEQLVAVRAMVNVDDASDGKDVDPNPDVPRHVMVDLMEKIDLRRLGLTPTADPATPFGDLSVWMSDFETPTPDPTPTIPSADSSFGPSRMGDLEDPNKAITPPFPLAERGELTRLERLAIRGDFPRRGNPDPATDQGVGCGDYLRVNQEPSFPPREDKLNAEPSASSAEEPEADPQQEIGRLQRLRENLHDQATSLITRLDTKPACETVQQDMEELTVIRGRIQQVDEQIRHLQQILAYQNSAFGRAHAALRRFFDKFKHRENVRS